jgi:hypothetical protein
MVRLVVVVVIDLLHIKHRVSIFIVFVNGLMMALY